MPYLSIQSNRTLPEKKQTELLGAASKIVASELGKPESYVMVSFAPGVRMSFAGEEGPTAFLELRSIGIPDDSGAQAVQRSPDHASCISADTQIF
jgi:phenylpyruvate tautomerase